VVGVYVPGAGSSRRFATLPAGLPDPPEFESFSTMALIEFNSRSRAGLATFARHSTSDGADDFAILTRGVAFGLSFDPPLHVLRQSN
jgi:hypothetical protein